MLRQIWKALFPTQERLSDDEKAVLKRLEARMETVERDAARREMEWLMWYDKFRTLFARLAKRVERAEDIEKPAQDALGSTMSQDGHNIPRQWQLAELAKRGSNGA